jgi:hypothetical protein
VAVTVSIARSDDAEELADALQGLVPQLSRSNPPPSLDAVRAMLAHEAITQFLARDVDGRIVGVSTLAAFPMLDRARQLGCATVDLTSRPSREAANHLYKKVGFTERETNVYRYELDRP